MGATLIIKSYRKSTLILVSRRGKQLERVVLYNCHSSWEEASTLKVAAHDIIATTYTLRAKV